MPPKTTRSQRLTWVRWQDQYSRRGTVLFQGAFRLILGQIPFERMTRQNFKDVVNNSIPPRLLYQAIEEFYRYVLFTHGRRMIELHESYETAKREAMPIETKNQALFNQILADVLADLLNNWAGRKIRIMRRTFAKMLIDWISEMVVEGLSMDEVTRNIFKESKKKGFYRWQIDRIVRTETTFVANRAAFETAERSGILLAKRWVTIQDARTREIEDGDKFDHYDMDGDTVKLEDYFEVPTEDGDTEKLLHPGHPDGSPGNIINCRCVMVGVPVLDADGNPIPNPRRLVKA